ncbi:MAG: hypothetical protein R2867_39795 [Caldilineaceae bacterium]
MTVNATIDTATLATLPAGNHTIYVHGLDNGGNWGKTNFGVLNLDKAGPTTSALTLTPNPSDGTVAVALHGSADDSASGKSNIVAFEYTIDGGAATNSAVSANSPNASLDAVIAAGLTPGTYAVAVRSQDALGNWGPYTTINLVVDTGGPTTSDVTVAPNPNNGAVGVSSGQPSVRVDALITEAAGLVAADRQANLAENQVFVPLVIASSRTQIAESTEATASAVPSGPYVKGAEGFIGTVGVDGTGFAFFAVDGKFDSVSEAVYVMIPLTTIEKLSEGPHPIHVHGQDGTGNWGDTVSVDLLIDRGLPTVSIVSVDPNPTNEVPNIAVVASATDAATTIAAAEWFVGADPGVGNGTAMTVNGSGPGNVTATINVSSWSNGDYTLTVRAKDAAGNWSATDSIVLTVENPLVLYLSTFGTTSVPNVAGPYDDADIYGWSGTNFLRAIDATGIGLPGGVNVDGLKWVSETDLYVSLTGNWNIPGPGSAQDEDILHYDGTNWSVYFDGTAHGLTTSNHDIDAFDIVGGNIYFSTLGTATISGAGGPYDDADIYRWDGTSFSRVFDASGHGLPGGADVDALDVIDENHFYLSFNGNVSISGFGGVQDEDVVEYNNGTWSVFFDATAAGLTGGGQDIDAIDVP